MAVREYTNSSIVTLKDITFVAIRRVCRDLLFRVNTHKLDRSNRMGTLLFYLPFIHAVTSERWTLGTRCFIVVVGNAAVKALLREDSDARGRTDQA